MTNSFSNWYILQDCLGHNIFTKSRVSAPHLYLLLWSLWLWLLYLFNNSAIDRTFRIQLKDNPSSLLRWERLPWLLPTLNCLHILHFVIDMMSGFTTYTSLTESKIRWQCSVTFTCYWNREWKWEHSIAKHTSTFLMLTVPDLHSSHGFLF